MSSTDFWKGRRVLVTGSTGFKGSWLCLWLESLGSVVIGMAKSPPTEPNLFTILSPWPSLKSHIGDIQDLIWVKTVVHEVKPEVVIHLAAQSLVRPSYAMPVLTFETNVMGTVNLLEAIRGVDSVRAVLVVTSDKIYRNDGHEEPFRESDPLGGSDPYSASKACEELVSHAYSSSYWQHSMPRLGTARGGNVIGGGDWSVDRLVPDIFRALAAGNPVTVRNPKARRPWQHVLELLAGYLRYAEKLATSTKDIPRALNFGPGVRDAQPVSWVVDQLTDDWADNRGWNVDDSSAVPEANTLTLSSDLAQTVLDWRPKLTLRQALRWATSWHQAYQHGSDMRTFTQKQITHYESL